MLKLQAEPMYKSDLIAKVYFLLQGIGTLISWNAVLNGLDYFADKYPQYNTNFILPIAFNGAQVFSNFFIPIVCSSFALKYRVIVPLMIITAVLVFLPLEANLLYGTSLGFYIILGMLFLLGFFSNLFQGVVSGFVGQFPFKYTSFFLMGTGLAGLLMNILRAIAIVSFSNMAGGALTEILVYFAIAGLVLASCMVIHPIFMKSAVCKYYLGNARTNTMVTDERTDALISNADRSEALVPTSDNLPDSPQSTESESGMSLRSIFGVFRQVWFFVMLLVLNYVFSFLTYPGVMFEKPVHALPIDWKIVTMLSVYNACDVIGKNIAQYRQLYTKWTVFGVTMSRLIFNALFIIQAITSSVAVLNTIWFGYINIALFGFTNGFVTTSSFIMGPEQVQGKKKEIAGFLSVAGLTTGIMIGGLAALPLANLNANNQ